MTIDGDRDTDGGRWSAGHADVGVDAPVEAVLFVGPFADHLGVERATLAGLGTADGRAAAERVAALL